MPSGLARSALVAVRSVISAAFGDYIHRRVEAPQHCAYENHDNNQAQDYRDIEATKIHHISPNGGWAQGGRGAPTIRWESSSMRAALAVLKLSHLQMPLSR
jgi:hypothetical protein